MNENIIKFISQQTCATVCCVDVANKPYSFSCFYAFDEKEALLIYKSAKETKHSQCILENPFVAGTILPDKLNKLHIKGLQFEGEVLSSDDTGNKEAASIYYKVHPLARAMSGDIWVIRIASIKFTDNALGFGKKLGWQRESAGVN